MLADSHGNVIHLGERDCSLQRRHQKLIEESPAPAVDAELRARIGKIATDAAAAVNYTGAGTIEGLLQDGEYFFLEMNTRVQVEHCVTEMVTGIDIVKEGIRVAAGAELSIAQDDVQLRGHAIECRINAEDASKNFAPAPGDDRRLPRADRPGRAGRLGRRPGSEISPMYDPMVAKLIVWDADREQATSRMLRALGEYEITELKTLIPFHRAILQTRQWADAETCRDLIEDRKLAQAARVRAGRAGRRPRTTPRRVEQTYTVEVSGKRFDVKVIGAAPRMRPRRPRQRRRAGTAAAPRRARGRRRRRRRHARLAAAGHDPPGRRGGRRRRRGGRADRRDRGDEDGERDHRPQGGHGRRAADLGRRVGLGRRHARRHHRRRRVAAADWPCRRGVPRADAAPSKGCRSSADIALARHACRRDVRRRLRSPAPARATRSPSGPRRGSPSCAAAPGRRW